MSRSILEVKGIGPAAAALLAENGMTSVEELAAKTPLQVAAVKGFREIRAAQVIAHAQALLAEAPLIQGAPADMEKPPKEKKVKAEKGQGEKSKKKKKGKKEKEKKKEKKAGKEGKKAKKNQKKKK